MYKLSINTNPSEISFLGKELEAFMVEPNKKIVILVYYSNLSLFLSIINPNTW